MTGSCGRGTTLAASSHMATRAPVLSVANAAGRPIRGLCPVHRAMRLVHMHVRSTYIGVHVVQMQPENARTRLVEQLVIVEGHEAKGISSVAAVSGKII